MEKTKRSTPDKLILAVKSRQVFGKKLKQLRREGQLPANIFGEQFKSQAITVNFKDFIKVYRTAKETSVVYLQFSKNEIPVLIQNLQKHPVTDLILHVDFRKVDLSKKIETEVPVKIIGQSEAVVQKGGVLLTLAKELKIEARPEDLPPQIEVDITVLKEINQEIKVADLPKNPLYTITDPPEKVIVSVVAHKEEAVEPETTTETPEIITEKEKPAEEETGQKSKTESAPAKTPAPKSPETTKKN